MSAVRGQSACRPPSGNDIRRVTPGKTGSTHQCLRNGRLQAHTAHISVVVHCIHQCHFPLVAVRVH
eukprot:8390868-Alexandrium_andersonii.AAC.1